VQRRRRKKAAPKNVFGSTSQSNQTTKKGVQKLNSPKKNRRQIAPPPSVPGSRTSELSNQNKKPPQTKPNLIEKKLDQPVVDLIPELKNSEDLDEIKQEEINAQEEITPESTEIVQNQILGKRTRKDLGLNKEKNEKIKDVEIKSSNSEDSSGTSLRARQIIQDSMLKASKAVEKKKSVSKNKLQPRKPQPSEPPKKPQKKFRNKTSSYQPANRAKRLDRSRHMEYKYEMRGLLTEINVAEEHRSNLLATIWARGERQTTIEAKDFLEEKLSEGILDEDQLLSLEKVVDRYTVRR